MSPEERERRKKAGEFVGTQALQAVEGYMEKKFEPALKGANRPTRYVLKTVPKLGSGIYATAKVLTAKDKPRALIGALGGWAGGAAGGALGAATGPGAFVAAPIGVVVGSAAGEEFAEDLYDAHHEAIRKKMADTKRWMKDRETEVYANASRMMAPYWQVDDLNRARRR